jgi:uncharacterized membrane protein
MVMSRKRRPGPEGERTVGTVLAAALLLGTGLGGFLDGILLHQIFQWHNMLSSKVPPTDLLAMKINMVWDGLFHALTWLMTVAGIAVLFMAGRDRQATWSGRHLLGGCLGGWGLFNAVEGLIDHQILGLHHVHPGQAELAWDLGFLASGVGLMVVGACLVRGFSLRARRGPATS